MTRIAAYVGIPEHTGLANSHVLCRKLSHIINRTDSRAIDATTRSYMLRAREHTQSRVTMVLSGDGAVSRRQFLLVFLWEILIGGCELTDDGAQVILV